MLFTREQLEDKEYLTLAPYGMKSRETRGRQYPDEEHPYRTAYQRDRDRILHTTAFRRLEYKTQVFVITEGDYYRTRLTHTLEVAQIGRTLARALGANEVLTEAICLVHDIGHTPFGHAGEYTMRRLMRDYGGFNHQQQSLRVVDELEERFPEHRGLNLTYEVREGIAKHETAYDAIGFGDFDLGEAPTLESQLASASDEIAYNTADLDDGLRAGLLDPRDLDGLEFWREWRDTNDMRDVRFDDMVRHKFIRWLINEFVTDFVTTTDARLTEHNIQSVADVRAFGGSLAVFSDEFEEKAKPLREFLYNRFYQQYRVMRMASKADQVIERLFNAYLAEPKLLPPQTQARLEDEIPARVVCDYIAGMTDRYALDEYARLFDP
ncbi:MAG TPA: deoxyguanosinetriphosphate triphosphohydrolase, partial [Anaerolineae bacterium]|nr:deoxyguanosinetriphosphate triphosphohydrolase [Anaerolineae bacterium]